LEDVALVNLFSAHDADPDVGESQDRLTRSCALTRREPFRIVDADAKILTPPACPSKHEAGRQDHGGRDHRTGPWTPPRLIDSRNQPEASGVGKLLRGFESLPRMV